MLQLVGLPAKSIALTVKKAFSKNRRSFQVIITLIVLSLIVAFYYLLYVPERENEIVQRKFRTLKRINENINQKIDGYKSIAGHIRGAYNDVCKSPDGKIVADTFFSKEKIEAAYKKDQFYIDIQFIPWPQDTSAGGDTLKAGFDTVQFTPDRKDLEIINFDATECGKYIQTTVFADFEKFITPLLREDIFEEYIVLNNERVLYESFHSGIGVRKDGLDSLFKVKDKLLTGKIVKLETGGEKYMAFLQPAGKAAKEDIIVMGLLKRKDFENEKRQLPASVVTYLTVFAIAILLLLPFIKFLLMGKRERIQLKDLAFSYLSIMLLMNILFFIFLRSHYRFVSEPPDPKAHLAASISKSLTSEIAEMKLWLDKLDNHYYQQHDSLQKFNIVWLGYEKMAIGKFNLKVPRIDNSWKTSLLSTTANREKLKKVSQIFWIDAGKDSPGKEIANWNTGQTNYPHGNFENRQYFKDVIKGDTISLSAKPIKGFAIEPINSRTDGQFKVVIAKRSRKANVVAAVSLKLHSVMKAALPLGYQFAIFKKDGEVLFHSDTTRNFNENLLEELTDPDELSTAIQLKSHSSFETRYNGKNFKVLTQPVDGLPFFIAVFDDESYTDSVKLQSFIYSFGMSWSFFCFLCIELLILLLIHYRQGSVLRRNRLDIRWIFPRPADSPKYLAVTLYHLLLTALLVLFCLPGVSGELLPQYIFMLVTGALLGTIFTCSTVIKSGKLKLELKLSSRVFIVFLIAVLAASFADGLSSGFDLSHLRLYGFVLAALAATALFMRFFTAISSYPQFKKHDHLSRFRMMVFSRIIMTCGIPMIIFYVAKYDFEMRLTARQKLLDFAEKIERYAGASPDAFDELIKDTGSKDSVKTFYTDSSWITSVGKATYPENAAGETYTPPQKNALKLLDVIRPGYSRACETSGFECLANPDNSPYFKFSNLFEEPDRLDYHLHALRKSSLPGKDILLVSSDSLGFVPPVPYEPYGILFYVLLAVGLLCLYKLVNYAFTKIFGESIVARDYPLEHNHLYFEPDGRRFFVQGLPGLDKRKIVEDALREKHKRMKPLDLFEVPDEKEYSEGGKEAWAARVKGIIDDEKVKTVILNHFEYNINDWHTGRLKLNLIEKLTLTEKHIIIISTVEPSSFLESVRKSAGDKKEDMKDREQVYEDLQRWRILLGTFQNITVSMKTPDLQGQRWEEKTVKEITEEECRYSKFMEYLPEAALQKVPKHERHLAKREVKEYALLELQRLAYHYYQDIWHSLTYEEQIALYDLAEEGLLNTHNVLIINMLIAKGLVQREEGNLRIMNDSFRNFILSICNDHMINLVEQEIHDAGTWKDYRYLIFIILGALIWFLFMTNPDKVEHILPILSALLVTGIPAVIKVVSYMLPNSSKPPAAG